VFCSFLVASRLSSVVSGEKSWALSLMVAASLALTEETIMKRMASKTRAFLEAVFIFLCIVVAAVDVIYETLLKLKWSCCALQEQVGPCSMQMDACSFRITNCVSIGKNEIVPVFYVMMDSFIRDMITSFRP